MSESSKARAFPLATVLTVTTGIMFVADIGQVYEILNFMTGDNLFTHQLPRANGEVRPHVFRQHPILELPENASVGGALGEPVPHWKEWLAAAALRLPAEFLLEPIPRDDHSFRDPVAELEAMIGKDRVIIVRPGESE